MFSRVSRHAKLLARAHNATKLRKSTHLTSIATNSAWTSASGVIACPDAGVQAPTAGFMTAAARSLAPRVDSTCAEAKICRETPSRAICTAPKQGDFDWQPNIVRSDCGLYVDYSLPRTFDKILIANRGEIACRVIRTCKLLGIKTVAVYSQADANALFVKLADEAYCIGPAASAQSYLRGDYIIELAKKVGAQAIHPGYGFLSENAEFAKACFAAGVEFIGPPVAAITDMGSKSASKIIMLNAGVPCVPGYHGEDQSDETLFREAEKTGYPIMLKAVSGGGGKGMRIVWKPEDFMEALEGCRREALASFKDDRVLLERYIQNPRHIEFQIFADKHGNVVHLYERDCSVQRRHQKVFEEAPAPGMTPELRAKMGKAATDAARAVGYVGAGTVEFIVDADTNEYFFMEMNTRLQVEHCVSEMIVQRDFVQWQLHVAAGYPLPVKSQDDITAKGHALELRVYAENPHNNFFPATGSLVHLRAPELAQDVRVETGVRQGDEVSIFYDPMISKLVTWGPDRQSCIARMRRALEDYQIVGPPNNIEFALRTLENKEFLAGGVTTKFIATHLNELVPPVTPPPNEAVILAAVKLIFAERAEAAKHSTPATTTLPKFVGDAFTSAWQSTDSFRVNDSQPTRKVDLLVGGQAVKPEDKRAQVSVEFKFPKDISSLQLISKPYDLVAYAKVGNSEPVLIRAEVDSTGRVKCMIGDTMLFADVVVTEPSSSTGSEVHVFGLQGKHYTFNLPLRVFGASLAAGMGAVAPMAGKVVKVNVKAGDAVKQGQPLVVMEAMKMEHILRAAEPGVVKAVLYVAGDFVEGGKPVVVFEGKDE